MVALSFLTLAPQVQAQTSAPRPGGRIAVSQSAKSTHYSFAFVDADIATVADEVLGRTLNLPYSVDQGLTAKVSLRIDRQLTPIQLLEAFEAALEASDVVMVREGDGLIVRSRAKARTTAGPPAAGSGQAIGYATQSVTLAYARPTEVAKALQAMSSSDPVVFADDKQGVIVLGGSGETLKSLAQIAKSFDHSGLESAKIRFFELNTAPAETLATELTNVLKTAGFSGATVMPLKRLNGVLVFARTSQALDEVASWIIRLDVPSRDKSATLFVYHPRNTSAESLGATLSSVISGVAGGTRDSTSASRDRDLDVTPRDQGQPSTTPLTSAGDSQAGRSALDGDPARLGVDKDSNTILIFTTPSRWVQIQRVLDEIDRPPRQVMIEASILEVTLNKRDSLGVDWSVIGAGGKLAVSSIYSAAGVVAPTSPALSVAYLSKDVSAAIAALGTQGQVEVVSSPKVLALDNHTARLDVGDQVPIVTQTGQSTISSGAPVIDSVSYRDTGIILKVKPRISGDNRIALDVDQEVSSVSETTSSAINSPTIQQRKISTSLMLTNGSTVALGGLISSNHQYTDTGLPILKDVPLLGNLFKTSVTTRARTELIVLLTAKVVDSDTSSQRITQEVLADMRELERRGLVRAP